MEKLKFKFKTLSNTEVDAKNYDLTIRESLFGGHTFTLKDGNEIKYLKMESIRSVLTGKNEIVLTDMADDHIVGIIEGIFDENNVHNRTFVSEIESDAVQPQPDHDPDPIDPNEPLNLNQNEEPEPDPGPNEEPDPDLGIN